MAAVAAGQREQRFDQRPGLVYRVPDLDGHGFELTGSSRGLRERDVDRGPHHGERGAQLVRRIRDEPALARERRIEPCQHPVERVRELLELVRWPGQPYRSLRFSSDAFGGAAGVLLGAGATAGYAVAAAQPTVVPAVAVLAGLGIALGTGGLAGVYPAVKAARLAPAEALRATSLRGMHDPLPAPGDQHDGRHGQAPRGDAQASLPVVEH